jgi:hypothetical protein
VGLPYGRIRPQKTNHRGRAAGFNSHRFPDGRVVNIKYRSPRSAGIGSNSKGRDNAKYLPGLNAALLSGVKASGLGNRPSLFNRL